MVINGFNIKLPIGLEQVLSTPVRDSYQDFLVKDDSLVRRHLTALTTLLPKYIGKPKRVLHVFGGVGATAQVIDQTCGDGVTHEFWERDPILVEYLKKEYPHCQVRYTIDSYTRFMEEDVSGFDAIMFDPSVGTIKTPKMKDCWAKLSMLAPDVIWLSDTACAKIHINAKFYEKDFGVAVEPTAEGYLLAYNHYLNNLGLNIIDAMREAAETYCVIQRDGATGQFPLPIPYL